MKLSLCPFRKEKRVEAIAVNCAHIPVNCAITEDFLPCIGKKCAAFIESEDEKEKFFCKILEGVD